MSCTLFFLSLPGAARARSETQEAGQHTSIAKDIDNLRRAVESAKPRNYDDIPYGPRQSPDLDFIQRYLVRYGETIVPALLPLLADQDRRISEAAADVLQRITSHQAQDAVIAYSLRNLLEQPRMTKWLTGVGYDRLIAIGIPALPAITRAYHQYASVNQRGGDYLSTLIQVAASMPNQAGLPLIEEAFEHACPDTSGVAARELARMQGQASFSRLVKFLERFDTNTECPHVAGGKALTCRLAVSALVDMGNPDAVEPIYKLMLKLDPEPQKWRERVTYYPSCLQATVHALDKLTGQTMDGNPQRIGAWVENYHRGNRNK